MIGIDANVVLRYLLADDPEQSPVVRDLIDKRCTPQKPALVSLVTLAEVWWFLAKKQKRSKSELVLVLDRLLGNPNVALMPEDVVVSASDAFSQGQADFPDYLVYFENMRLGAKETFSFDRDASRTFMTLLR
jgi:predicted nucleic-acid-binding protein